MEINEKNLQALHDEMQEDYNGGINAGQTAEFLDYLEPESREAFEQMAELAEGKKKWLRLYDKMMAAINDRDFDNALAVFEQLNIELF